LTVQHTKLLFLNLSWTKFLNTLAKHFSNSSFSLERTNFNIFVDKVLIFDGSDNRFSEDRLRFKRASLHFPHNIQFSYRYYIKAYVLKRSNSWWTRGIRTMSVGARPFGLAHSASFNEIDRVVIEMRTKLARDNTRPLISAAKNAPTTTSWGLIRCRTYPFP